MEETNSTPTPAADQDSTKPAPKTYRQGSACWAVQSVVASYAVGENFDLKSVVDKYVDFCNKNNVEVGSAVRNVRYVVQAMLKTGELVRVKRGNWKRS